MLLGDPLLLLRWAHVITVSVDVFRVEQAFKGLNQLCLLVLDLPLVSVAREVDILSLFCLPTRPLCLRCRLRVRIEWALLVELVEAASILVILDGGGERGLLLSEVSPVKSSKERMALNFVYPVGTQPILSITEESLENICRWPTELRLFWNCEGLSPSKDFLAGDARLV